MDRRLTPVHCRRLAAPLALTLLITTAACFRLPGGAAPAPAVPSGTVVAFAGPQVPAGWTLCDGRRTPGGQPTPDLRARFVLGADTGAADAGQSGGSATHTHAVASGPGRGSRGTETDNDISVATSGHTHEVTASPTESLPPYVKLLYIMKD